MQSTAASQFISTADESLENWYLYYRKSQVFVGSFAYRGTWEETMVLL